MTRLDRPFVAIFPDQVKALGSIEAAAVLQFIGYSQAGDPAGVVMETKAIADGTGLPLRTVQRVTSRLREAGHLTSERSGPWVPTLRWRVLISAGQGVSANMAVTCPPQQVVSLTATMAVTPPYSESLEVPPSSPPPSGPSADTDEQGLLPFLASVPDQTGSSDEAGEFAAWWSLYPRKDDRKPAAKAYRTARRRASAEALLDGLRAHLPAYQARIDAGERTFIPLGATWLNKERWLNEPPEVRQTRTRNPFANPALLAGGDR